MLPSDMDFPNEWQWESLTDDIFVRGSDCRNRALHGDTVYVEILPLREWNYSYGSLDAAHRKDDVEVDDDIERRSQLPGIPLGRVVAIVQRTSFPIYCVLRTQKYNSRNTIEDELRFDASDKFVRAVSIDKRFPWFLVETASFMREYGQILTSTETRNREIVKVLPEYVVFQVKLQAWRDNDSLPKATIVGVKGECLDVEFEANYALSLYELEDWADPLSPEVERWAADRVQHIKDNFEAIAKERVDLRHLPVISIDPATARDLDDAIHVRRLSKEEVCKRYKELKRGNVQYDDVLEVGVHIADVSFVISPDSPVDKAAQTRTTTVYLPHKAYHMLPRIICQELCSLDASSDKLAFSVLAYFDAKTGKLINNGTEWKGVWAPRYAHSVIRNKARLNYDQVQDLLETQVKETKSTYQAASDLVAPVDVRGSAATIETDASYKLSSLTEDVRMLYKIAKGMRAARFANGTLELASLQLRFNCGDNKRPKSIVEDVHSDSHWLIEELMLLANQLVAQRVFSSPIGPQFTLLRTHPPLSKDKLIKLVDKLTAAGIKVGLDDFRSPESISNFLVSIHKQRSTSMAMMVEQMVIMSLEQAIYEWSGRLQHSTRHFALGFDLYTHFTSPIRRYADILVHRQLDLVLQTQDITKPTAEDLHEWRMYIENACKCEEAECIIQNDETKESEESTLHKANTIRMRAKRAGDKASNSWLLMYLLDQPAPLTTRCIVTSIADRSFKVHLPELFNDVRVEFDIRNDAQSRRSLRKVRPQHIKQISIPTAYTLLYADGSEVGSRGEDVQIKETDLTMQTNLRVDIQWRDVHRVIRVFEEIEVWVVPSREVPLSLVVIPVPPKAQRRPIEKTKKGTEEDELVPGID